MPVNREAPLVSKTALGDDYVLLSFRHPEVAHGARAGQFVMIKPGSLEPAEDVFTLFVKAIGGVTRGLAALTPGERALCLGPLGHGFGVPPAGTEALMVAGGYGIAPFVLLARELQQGGRAGRVFYGGRSARDLKLRGPFAALGTPLVLVSEDGSLGERGKVTAPLEAHLDQGGAAALYACGPEPMLHAVAAIGARRGLPVEVSLDPWMGCGVGTCLGCVVRVQRPGEPRWKYRCACTEGPVFDARTVVWPGAAVSRAAGEGSAA
jgi:dihydroorotate dehydrogenase electron transfer subunit